ncbi:MAG: NADH-quinone oxidoreductase subunit L [Verrucomicrobiota bacterium]
MLSVPWIILLLPLASAVIITLVTHRNASLSALISVASAATTLALTIWLLAQDTVATSSFEWIKVGDSFTISLGLIVDKLSQGMMFIVTAVGTAVHVFSLGYMKTDEGKSRYFAGLSLFMFSMTGIVLADNFVMMFIFWELVGVSSYILIGHWFEKNSAAEAAKKAFIVNRIGDFGFMVGILLVWGLTGSVYFEDIEAALPGGIGKHILTTATLCIFAGAVGKSAQIPLHVWLPDAMEGPTPVSALIHAATMVAAGVYMLARTFFLIEFSNAGIFIAWIGAITCLLAALMAIQQDDIKRVLAYSTLSQLGYMVLAVGVHNPEAGMFHLYTHAFFKSLLFLSSGAVIYACHHEQNIWKMGGLRKKLPITTFAFLCGTLALTACPLTSGFWSKEHILHAALDKHGSVALFSIGLAVAFLTAFYMGRLFTVAFFGKPRDHASEDAKEVPPVMWIPICILSVFALFGAYKMFWGPLKILHPAPPAHSHPFILYASIAAFLLGIGSSYLIYRHKNKDPLHIPLFANRFYIDNFYDLLVRFGTNGLAYVAKSIDQILIDGLAVRGSAKITSSAGSMLRRLQVGNLQGYAFLFGFGIIVVIYLTLFSRS